MIFKSVDACIVPSHSYVYSGVKLYTEGLIRKSYLLRCAKTKYSLFVDIVKSQNLYYDMYMQKDEVI